MSNPNKLYNDALSRAGWDASNRRVEEAEVYNRKMRALKIRMEDSPIFGWGSKIGKRRSRSNKVHTVSENEWNNST